MGSVDGSKFALTMEKGYSSRICDRIYGRTHSRICSKKKNLSFLFSKFYSLGGHLLRAFARSAIFTGLPI